MAPTGHRKSAPQKRQKAVRSDEPLANSNTTRLQVTEDSLQNLGEAFAATVGFKLKDFQLEAVKHQLLRKDTLVHAGTGSGKTAIAAAPHFHPSAKGMITVMVSPLLALQNEQVLTFKNEYKLKAIAVNSSHGGCTPEALSKLKSREEGYQILLISPELLLSKRFVETVLRDKDFTSRIMSVVVDEAHVVSHWGAGFRKKYGELGMGRAFLTKGTPVVAMSATLSPYVRNDVLRKLEFSKTDFHSIDRGNDRPNVALIARAIEHTQESLLDLNFVIPVGVKNAEDIPLTMVYADSVALSPALVDHLNSLLPSELQNTGLIRPFNASYSHKYRRKLLSHFKRGKVRVLVCTDAAGMGCNIPAVDVVVQWKLPSSLSLFVQRAGRAARAPSRRGVGILLVEKSVYSQYIEEQERHMAAPKKKGKSAPRGTDFDGAVKRTRKDTKAHAMRNGVLRGSSTGTKDGVVGGCRDVEPDPLAVDEGLLAFVQTTMCRRRVVTKIYQNQISSPATTCCDLCHPELLDMCRPPRVATKKRRTTKKPGEPIPAVQTALWEWRTKVHETDYPLAPFGPPAILSDEQIHLLASVGRIETEQKLGQTLGTWAFEEQYSSALLTVLKGIAEEHFTIMAHIPEPSSAGKRTGREDDGGEEEESQTTTNALTSQSAPISISMPAPSTSSSALATPALGPQALHSHQSTPTQWPQATVITPRPIFPQYNPYNQQVYEDPVHGHTLIFDYTAGVWRRVTLPAIASPTPTPPIHHQYPRNPYQTPARAPLSHHIYASSQMPSASPVPQPSSDAAAAHRLFWMGSYNNHDSGTNNGSSI